MASLDFEQEKNKFRDFYSDNHDMLNDATSFYRSLIASLVASIENIETPTVIARLKDREESIKKFSLKYQTDLEMNKEPYSIQDHITDLIGIRVICYYENDIQKVAEVLKKNFTVLSESNKSAEIEEKENTFGYKGHHLDLKINDERSKILEYSRYKEIRFEVQARSIIQDAWSVLDHKIKYKKSIPPALKRQINALAALFEIADREFTQIKDTTQELEKGQSLLPNTSEFDVFAFISITAKEFPSYPPHGYKADGFTQEILQRKSNITLKEFEDAVKKYKETVELYTEFQLEEHKNILNVFTKIRHMLYLSDKETFKLMLYDNQRSNFDKWLSNRQLSNGIMQCEP